MNFGFGAGGYKPEYQSYGFEFIEKGSVRLAQVKEALQLILGLWSHPRFTFHGKYFHVENVILEPKPLQKPHPPILIGGAGPKVTAKRLVVMNPRLKRPHTILCYARRHKPRCKQK